MPFTAYYQFLFKSGDTETIASTYQSKMKKSNIKAFLYVILLYGALKLALVWLSVDIISLGSTFLGKFNIHSRVRMSDAYNGTQVIILAKSILFTPVQPNPISDNRRKNEIRAQIRRKGRNGSNKRNTQCRFFKHIKAILQYYE